jgi:hypothetical protein
MQEAHVKPKIGSHTKDTIDTGQDDVLFSSLLIIHSHKHHAQLQDNQIKIYVSYI